MENELKELIISKNTKQFSKFLYSDKFNLDEFINLASFDDEVPNNFRYKYAIYFNSYNSIVGTHQKY